MAATYQTNAFLAQIMLTGLFFLILLAGCDAENSESTATQPPLIEVNSNELKASAKSVILYLGSASDSLRKSISVFLSNPSIENQKQCHKDWLSLHKSFIELEYYFNRSFQQSSLSRLVYDIHRWPIQPGFVDSIASYPDSGFVNDLVVPINKSALLDQQGITSPDEISLGLHVLEFLLWRSVEDYIPATSLSVDQQNEGLKISDLRNNRRRNALELITEILVDHTDSIRLLLLVDSEINADFPVSEPLESMQYSMSQIASEIQYLMREPALVHSRFSSSSLHTINTRIDRIVNSYSRESNIGKLRGILDDNIPNEFKMTLDELDEVSKNPEQIKLLYEQLNQQFSHLQNLITTD